MRIMLLTHSYTPEVSPPQRRWSQFITHFRQRGWEVVLSRRSRTYPKAAGLFPRTRLAGLSAGMPVRTVNGSAGCPSFRTGPPGWADLPTTRFRQPAPFPLP